MKNKFFFIAVVTFMSLSCKGNTVFKTSFFESDFTYSTLIYSKEELKKIAIPSEIVKMENIDSIYRNKFMDLFNIDEKICSKTFYKYGSFNEYDVYACDYNRLVPEPFGGASGDIIISYYDGVKYKNENPFYFIDRNLSVEELNKEDLIPFAQFFIDSKIDDKTFWDMFFAHFSIFRSTIIYQYERSGEVIDLESFYADFEKNKEDLTREAITYINYSYADFAKEPSYSILGDTFWFKSSSYLNSNDLKLMDYSTMCSNELKEYLRKYQRGVPWTVKYPESNNYINTLNYDDFSNVIDFGTYSGYELFVSTSFKERRDQFRYCSFLSNNYGTQEKPIYIADKYFRKLFPYKMTNEILAFKEDEDGVHLTNLQDLFQRGIVDEKQITSISLQIFSYFYNNLEPSEDKEEFKNQYLNKLNYFYKTGMYKE